MESFHFPWDIQSYSIVFWSASIHNVYIFMYKPFLIFHIVDVINFCNISFDFPDSVLFQYCSSIFMLVCLLIFT